MKIKQATKQGYIECPIGGVFSIAYPDSKLRRGRVIKNGTIAPTLETQCDIGYIVQDGKKIKVRRLTPKECFRLQGWTDEYFEKAEMISSDGQLYKRAGNGVTVNVIQAIAERLDQ